MVQRVNAVSPFHSLLEDPDIHFVHYQWLCLSGLLKERIVTKHYALTLVQEQRALQVDDRPHLGQFSWKELPKSFGFESAVLMYPDWTSARIIRPGHIAVLCSASEESCGYTDTDHSKAFESCSRTVMLDIQNRFKTQWDIEFLVGFKLEFYLINPDEIGKSRDANLWGHGCQTSSHRGGKGLYMEACVDRLENVGISVQHYHGEGGESQFEIVLDPLPPCAAIDAMLHAQQQIDCPRTWPTGYIRAETFSVKSSNWSSHALVLHAIRFCISGLCLSIKDFGRYPESIALAFLSIEDGEVLELKDNKLHPSLLTLKEKEELGLKVDLPKSLEESVGIAEQGWQGLDCYLNNKILDVYLMLKKSHLKKMRQMSPEERAKYYTYLY